MTIPWYAIFGIGIVVGAMALWIGLTARSAWQIIKDFDTETR